MLQQNKYSDHIALHQRCLDILAARETFVQRLNSKENDLARWDNKPDTMFRFMVDRKDIVHNIEVLTMCVNRLTAYYEKHAGKVCAMLSPKIDMIENAWLPKGTDPKTGYKNATDFLHERYLERLRKYELLTPTEKSNPITVFGQVEAGIAHSESYGNAELNSHKLPLPCDFCVKPEGNDFSIAPLNMTPNEHITANTRAAGYC